MLDLNPTSEQDYRAACGVGVHASQSLKHNQVLKGQLLKQEEPGCMTLDMSLYLYLSEPQPQLINGLLMEL